MAVCLMTWSRSSRGSMPASDLSCCQKSRRSSVEATIPAATSTRIRRFLPSVAQI